MTFTANDGQHDMMPKVSIQSTGHIEFNGKYKEKAYVLLSRLQNNGFLTVCQVLSNLTGITVQPHVPVFVYKELCETIKDEFNRLITESFYGDWNM